LFVVVPLAFPFRLSIALIRLSDHPCEIFPRKCIR
jgi:hypothetical protein